MSKATKNERISTLEDAVAMNWSDMKKIETKISRAMTDMATRISNISLQLEGQQRQIHLAADSIGLNKQAIIMLKNKAEPKPQLKQLDQSVFDGLDEKWRFAAVDECSEAYIYMSEPMAGTTYFVGGNGTDYRLFGQGYDASNWQNSLIERDTAKELAGIDLSSELTGSELCKAMLARGDKYVSGFGHHQSDDGAVYSTFADTVTRYSHCFHSAQNSWDYFVPINNQGKPLTAAEVGL